MITQDVKMARTNVKMSSYDVRMASYDVRMAPQRDGLNEGQAVMGEHANGESPHGGRPTLGEVSRSMARARIVQGAAVALAAHGLDITADEVAEAAGVSRRTVFRHFATHGELIVTAIAELYKVVADRMPGPPAPGADVRAWLTESAVALHALNREVIGRAFWDIHIQRPGTWPEVTAALSDVTARRDQWARELATGAWRALGGKRTPPQWVIDAFALQLSGFATNAMAKYSTQEAGRVSAQILWTVLSTALSAQQQDTPTRDTEP